MTPEQRARRVSFVWSGLVGGLAGYVLPKLVEPIVAFTILIGVFLGVFTALFVQMRRLRRDMTKTFSEIDTMLQRRDVEITIGREERLH